MNLRFDHWRSVPSWAGNARLGPRLVVVLDLLVGDIEPDVWGRRYTTRFSYVDLRGRPGLTELRKVTSWDSSPVNLLARHGLAPYINVGSFLSDLWKEGYERVEIGPRAYFGSFGVRVDPYINLGRFFDVMRAHGFSGCGSMNGYQTPAIFPQGVWRRP